MFFMKPISSPRQQLLTDTDSINVACFLMLVPATVLHQTGVIILRKTYADRPKHMGGLRAENSVCTASDFCAMSHFSYGLCFADTDVNKTDHAVLSVDPKQKISLKNPQRNCTDETVYRQIYSYLLHKRRFTLISDISVPCQFRISAVSVLYQFRISAGSVPYQCRPCGVRHRNFVLSKHRIFYIEPLTHITAHWTDGTDMEMTRHWQVWVDLNSHKLCKELNEELRSH
jgi:hypothetical protein